MATRSSTRGSSKEASHGPEDESRPYPMRVSRTNLRRRAWAMVQDFFENSPLPEKYNQTTLLRAVEEAREWKRYIEQDVDESAGVVLPESMDIDRAEEEKEEKEDPEITREIENFKLDGKLWVETGLIQKPSADHTRAKFEFPLPEGHGLRRLNTQEDFKLPYGIYAPTIEGERTVFEWNHNLKKNQWVAEHTNKKKRQPWSTSSCSNKHGTHCGPACLNRSIQYECSHYNCSFGHIDCGNRLFTNLLLDLNNKKKFAEAYEVRPTDAKGLGLFSIRSYNPGSLIVEYTGEIIDLEEVDRRLGTLYKEKSQYYFLGIEANLVIDAGRRGSVARYVNHSCDPNCEMQKWYVDQIPRIGLFAKRQIYPGDEITYDYNFEWYENSEPQKCYCGTKLCRGVIGKRQPKDAPPPPPPPPPSKSRIVVQAPPPKVKKAVAKAVEEVSDDSSSTVPEDDDQPLLKSTKRKSGSRTIIPDDEENDDNLENTASNQPTKTTPPTEPVKNLPEKMRKELEINMKSPDTDKVEKKATKPTVDHNGARTPTTADFKKKFAEASAAATAAIKKATSTNSKTPPVKTSSLVKRKRKNVIDDDHDDDGDAVPVSKSRRSEPRSSLATNPISSRTNSRPSSSVSDASRVKDSKTKPRLSALERAKAKVKSPATPPADKKLVYLDNKEMFNLKKSKRTAYTGALPKGIPPPPPPPPPKTVPTSSALVQSNVAAAQGQHYDQDFNYGNQGGYGDFNQHQPVNYGAQWNDGYAGAGYNDGYAGASYGAYQGGYQDSTYPPPPPPPPRSDAHAIDPRRAPHAQQGGWNATPYNYEYQGQEWNNGYQQQYQEGGYTQRQYSGPFNANAETHSTLNATPLFPVLASPGQPAIDPRRR